MNDDLTAMGRNKLVEEIIRLRREVKKRKEWHCDRNVEKEQALSDRVAELRGLLNKATPGLWIWDGDDLYAQPDGEGAQHGDVLITDDRANAALIVAMHNTLPLLLDVVEALQRDVYEHCDGNIGTDTAAALARLHMEEVTR